MIVALGSDHAGFPLKTELIPWLQELGYEILDCGTNSTVPVDYPDFAKAVGDSVIGGRAERGIVVCGSGAGAAIASNKIRGIRAVLAHDTYTAHQCVEHDAANVIAVGSRVIGIELAREVIRAFLRAEFTGEERHVRRLNKVLQIEEGL